MTSSSIGDSSTGLFEPLSAACAAPDNLVKPADLLELGGARRTPMIRQSEAAECGLASLAMVAGYHGLDTDMPTLRRRFSVSLKGASLKALMQIAEQCGFIARPLRGEIEHLEQLPPPGLLYWNLNHFVVLTNVSRSARGRPFHLHDPAYGSRIHPARAFSFHLSGVLLALTPSENFRRRSERSQLESASYGRK